MTVSTPPDIPYNLLEHLHHASPLQGLLDPDNTSSQPHMQALATVYITTLYYSALTNLFSQSAVPTGEDIEDWPRLKIALTRSYTDFTTANQWLAEHGGKFIESSPAKNYYDEVTAMGKDSILDAAAFGKS